jgi:proteasome lid subunit RPN8/RPN11
MRSHLERLLLHPDVAADLHAQVAWSPEREVAGVLADDGQHVLRAFRVSSARNDARSFRIFDADLRRVTRAADNAGLVPCAIYHSHPSGRLELSPADRMALARASYPWVVIALASGRLVMAAHRSPDAAVLKIEVLRQPSQHVLQGLPGDA